MLGSAPGGVAEWLKAAVSKTVNGGFVVRGFESLPLRCSRRFACKRVSDSRVRSPQQRPRERYAECRCCRACCRAAAARTRRRHAPARQAPGKEARYWERRASRRCAQRSSSATLTSLSRGPAQTTRKSGSTSALKDDSEIPSALAASAMVSVTRGTACGGCRGATGGGVGCGAGRAVLRPDPGTKGSLSATPRIRSCVPCAFARASGSDAFRRLIREAYRRRDSRCREAARRCP
jgi:hypothetical protein